MLEKNIERALLRLRPASVESQKLLVCHVLSFGHIAQKRLERTVFFNNTPPNKKIWPEAHNEQQIVRTHYDKKGVANNNALFPFSFFFQFTLRSRSTGNLALHALNIIIKCSEQLSIIQGFSSRDPKCTRIILDRACEDFIFA